MALKTLQRIRGFKDDAVQRAFEAVYSVVDETVKTLNTYVNFASVNGKAAATINGSIYATGGYKYILGPFYFGSSAFSASQTNAQLPVAASNNGTYTTSPIEFVGINAGSIVGMYTGCINNSINAGTLQFGVQKNGTALLSGGTITPSTPNSSLNFTRGTYSYGGRAAGSNDYMRIVYTTNGSYSGGSATFCVFLILQDT